jgi:signal peptide peptidase SppA
MPAKGHSLIKFFTSTPWAILPEKLEQLEAVLGQFISGKNVKLSESTTEQFTQGKIAVIPIEGTLVKKAYGLQAMSGVRTTLDIKADIKAALANPEISGIVLTISSPGGTVEGTKELADYIKSVDAIKPVIAYADGTMASAAYWIGSAARHIVVFETSCVGSVGVISKHRDHSKALENEGVKDTYIYAGKYKAAGNPSEPLSSDAKEYLQSITDTFYGLFVDAVSENRSIDRDVVLKDIALGSIFIGQQAIDLKLADSMGTLEDAISLASKLGDEKMADDKLKVQVDEMQATMKTLSEKLVLAEQRNEKLQAEIAERDTKAAQDAKRVALEEQFAGCDVDGDFINSLMGMDENAVALIHKQISARQETIDKMLAEFQVETPDASVEGQDTHVNTIDSAIDMIEARDKCSTEEAEEKAMAEFPELFRA